MANLTEKEIQALQEKHEKIREILQKYGNEEFGDCIIDEICEAVGIPPTTVYYEEDDEEESKPDKIECDNCGKHEDSDEMFGVQKDNWSEPGYFMVCQSCLDNQN